MRTIVLVFLTAFVLAIGYMGYWWMQPNRAAKKPPADESRQPLTPAPNDSGKMYGPGKGAWVKRYDTDTAQLLSRFKADDYQPRNDGWVVVKNPRAQFFMKDGKAISIEGDTGEIVMDDQNRGGAKGLPAAKDTPSRGRLHNVRIKLFHEITSPEKQMEEQATAEFLKEHLGLTISLENAAFNNESFKITSEPIKGRGGRPTIPADEVPVTLRGVDYDFDGRGLTILWNERDRRLQYLEVVHGEKLTIWHPSSVMKGQAVQNSVAELDGAPVSMLPDWGWSGASSPLPLMLAAKGRTGVGEAINAAPAATAPATAPSARRRPAAVPKPKITPSNEPPLYIATFRDKVHITQGDDLNVNSELMTIQFLMQDNDADSSTTKPSTKPAGKGATTAPVGNLAATTKPTATAGDAPATTPSRRSPKRAVASTQPAPTTQAATSRPSNGETPIVITWTGALTIKPLTAEPESPLREGEAVVRLDGAPVRAVQNGSTIECGVLTYRTREQLMNLAPMSPDKPVVLKDAKGAIVRTNSMDFDQLQRKAILIGKSDAVFPQSDEEGKKALEAGKRPAGPLTAKWTKTCTLYFEALEKGSAPAGGQPALAAATIGGEKAKTPGPSNMTIERALLDGDVEVDRPGQLKLRSQQLELAFDKTLVKKVEDGMPAVAGGVSVPKIVAPAGNQPGDPTKEILAARKTALAGELKKAEAELAQVTGGEDLNARQATLLSQLDATDTRVREIQRRMSDLVSDSKADSPEAKALAEELPKRKTYRASLQEEVTQLGTQMLKADEVKRVVDATKAELAKMEGGSAPVKPAVAVKPAAVEPPPVFRSDLRQMIATGLVHCELTDSNQKTQVIDCQRLDLQTAKTPDGKVYPRTIIADGDVHAVDPSQDLRAGRMAVTLRPSTKAESEKSSESDTAAAQLESLLATTNVKVIGKDGTQALADQLIVDNKDGKNILKLLGQPMATLIDKRSTLKGPTIIVLPDDQKLQVVGAGTMKGYQESKATTGLALMPMAGAVAAAAGPVVDRPIDVKWDESLLADGKANTVDVIGHVESVTKDAEGATNTAKGKRMQMILVDVAPTAKPVATPAAAGAAPAVAVKPATTAPANAQAAAGKSSNPYGAMGNKAVRSVTFQDDAEVSSVTLDDKGVLVRRTHIEAVTITYDMLAKQMNIPVPGRMIVEDHRPQAAPAADAKPGENANNRGTTAFAWPKSFTYDDSTRIATMLGDGAKQVLIVHQDEKDPKKEFRLFSDRVNAELEAAAPEGEAPKPAAPAGGALEQQKVVMKRVTATGRLSFNGPGADVTADRMEFDPKTHIMTARGDGANRVVFSVASSPGGRKEADMIRYNLDTGYIQSEGLQIRVPR